MTQKKNDPPSGSGLPQQKQLKEWFRSLDDPDVVGQSEYRAVHELLESIVHGEHPDYDLVIDALMELEGWARAVRQSCRKWRKKATTHR